MAFDDVISAPDGPPQDVQLEALSSQSIRVTWRVSCSRHACFYDVYMHSSSIYLSRENNKYGVISFLEERAFNLLLLLWS